MTTRRAIIVMIATLALAACLSTKVESLAPNMIRINMTGTPAPSEESVFKDLLVLAAKETVARGYVLFRFAGLTPGPTKALAPGEPPTANFSVIVIMFQEGEPGVNGYFDARQILKTGATPQ